MSPNSALGRPHQAYNANHQSLLPEDQHPGFNQQLLQAGLVRENSTNNSSDMEHLLAINLEGDLCAAGDLRTLEAILDTSLTESTSSLDLRTNSQPELILPGQSVVDPLPFPRSQTPQGRMSPLFLERFLKEHPSSL